MGNDVEVVLLLMSNEQACGRTGVGSAVMIMMMIIVLVINVALAESDGSDTMVSASCIK